MDYIRLTEEIQGNTENKIIRCRFWDTDKCSIHNGGHCESCDVFGKILAQLYMCENALEEKIKAEVK